ncbi:hypothetical protein A2U01_0101085, partial [Trifolium medium]|nr:hypothetical protein [Trifolium medium]
MSLVSPERQLAATDDIILVPPREEENTRSLDQDPRDHTINEGSQALVGA